MTDFDPYSEKIADVSALIRHHGKCEAWELFKNAENGLEVLCAIVDAARAEAKAAVPAGYALVPLEPTAGMIGAAMTGASYDARMAVTVTQGLIRNYRKMIEAAPIAAVAEQTKQQKGVE
jgi:hypothetical protein